MIQHSVGDGDQIPVLLLKTRSTPHDGYEEHFSDPANGNFHPVFVPVLEHKFQEHALRRLKTLLRSRQHGAQPDPEGQFPYGGIIFTSQRAVEAFSRIITELRDEGQKCFDPLVKEFPLYVVGPATARGLRSLELPCAIVGDDSGNGEALAQAILQDYTSRPFGHGFAKLPLLFLVGEQRRDVIPKTLQSAGLDERERIQVDETIIYETGEMQSFRDDFREVLAASAQKGPPEIWVVVFSPTGCKAMLETLDLMPGGKSKDGTSAQPSTHIVTIGPTTRDYLVNDFDFAPDVCASKPSPEGVGDAIRSVKRSRARSAALEQNFATQMT